MNIIPNELCLKILRHLNHSDINNLCIINKNWNFICKDKYFWMKKAINNFGYPQNKFLFYCGVYPHNLYYRINKLLTNKSANFILAAKKGYCMDIKILLNYEIDNKVKLKALKIACQKDHYNMFEELLISGVNFIYSDSDCDNLIIAIVFYNQTQMLKLLLSRYDIIKNRGKNIALYYSTKFNNIDMTEFLLDNHIYDDKLLENIFLELCVDGKVDIVKCFLLNSQINPSFDNNLFLQSACNNYQYEVVNVLLSNKTKCSGRLFFNSSNWESADPSEITIFKYQACENFINCIKRLLLDDRFDPCKNKNKLLNQVIKFKLFDLSKLLLTDQRIIQSMSKNKLCYYEQLLTAHQN